MSTVSTFWQRINSALRPHENGITPIASLPDSPQITIVRTEPHIDRHPSNGGSDDSGVWRLLTGRKRREDELRQRYAHAVEMMDAIRMHMQVQDDHTGRISQSMERIAVTLENMSAAQKKQSESVETLVQRVEIAGKQVGSVMATVFEIPAALQAQAEAIRLVARRLDDVQDVDARLVGSLDRFAGSVQELRSSQDAQTATIRDTGSANERGQETLRTFIEGQNRRVMLVGVTTMIAAVAALSALVAVLVG